MTAATEKRNDDQLVVSGQALDVFDSFEGGFTDIVQEIAEHLARARTAGEQSSNTPVEITATDARLAAVKIISALKHMASEQSMPGDLVERLSRMNDQFSKRNW